MKHGSISCPWKWEMQRGQEGGVCGPLFFIILLDLSNFLSSWQQVHHSLSNYPGSCIPYLHHSTPTEVTKTNLSIGIDWPWQKGKWTLNWGGLGGNDTDSAACGRFLEEEKRGGINGVLNIASCCGGIEQSERRSLSFEKMFRVLCYQKPRTSGTQ